jgi:hypothetical protein
VEGSRAFLRLAEPMGRITREAGRTDERDSRIQMRPEILPQEPVVQWLAWRLGSRVGMCIDQPGQYPALGDEFGTGHRIRGPPVTVGIKIDRLAFGKTETADSQRCHHITPAPIATHMGPRSACHLVG